MIDKYISFSPYFSGLSNVIMSYELAFSIAYITNRKIILPHKTWLLFISQSQNLEDFSDIWQIFDKDIVKEEFDCIEFENVPEFEDKFLQMRGGRSYTQNIFKAVGIDNVGRVVFSDSDPYECVCNDHSVLVNKKYNDEDFLNFSKNRHVINLDRPEKILHFENNLFGSYWYHVYPGNKFERNKLKNKINKCFKYNKRLYELSDQVQQKIGKYNALHVRRNDFLDVHTDLMDQVGNSNKILEKILPLFDTKIPLYISTDETNLKFFDSLISKYNIYFFKDFDYNLDSLDTAALEQIICSNAELFYGTQLSTYTKRINVMRGYDGKESQDWKTINYTPPEKENIFHVNPLPWTLNENRLWFWDSSYHPQWILES